MADTFSGEQLEEWIQKAQTARASIDLSAAEDLSIGLMNLISLEEHFYFSAMKTDNNHYLELLDRVREVRKKVMQQLVTNPEGEEWCVSKHLLAASMRLIETGTKLRAQKKDEVAEYLFVSAFHLYSLFFAINKLVPQAGVSQVSLGKAPVHAVVQPQKSVLSTIAAIVKKAVDCCRE